MLVKWVESLYKFECHLFRTLNRQFERKSLNAFFRQITHLGGAWFTIAVTLIIIVFAEIPVKMWGIQSAAALTTSHILVSIVKKLYPRSRPYLALQDARVPANPLTDHSFPSGHTTAIFSIITPFIVQMPILSLILYPFGISVGMSRVFLGLHYPSDVLAGSIVGTLFGILMVSLI